MSGPCVPVWAKEARTCRTGAGPPSHKQPWKNLVPPTCVGHEAHGKEEVVSEG